MRLSDVPRCCAVNIFSGFERYADEEFFGNSLRTMNKKWRERIEKGIKKYLDDIGFDGVKLVIIILDDDQYSILGKIFKKHGFKKKQKFLGNDSRFLHLMTCEVGD